MPCLCRTFGIALYSFSHENNDLLFRMKILTRRYGIFVWNTTDLFKQKSYALDV